MKTNLAKNILSITIVSIVLALVLVTIILALVPKKLENLIPSGYTSITVYNDNLDQTYYYTANATDADAVKENGIYRKIEELHLNSLKDNLLSAMFQGTGSFDIRVDSNYYSNAITQAKSDSSKVLVFTFTKGEETLKIGGKEYRDTSALSSTLVTFDMIVMPIGSSDSFEECTIYLADRSTKNTSYQVKFLAHQSDLAKYISELTFPVV
ncbi:MAG: hypothetical protein ACI4PF_03410 [Christensenellales bacterium]